MVGIHPIADRLTPFPLHPLDPCLHSEPLVDGELGRSAGHIPDDGAVGAYVQSAAIVYNHYRLKSLEESIERRTLRRDAIFGGGTVLAGEARSQFIQRAIDEAVAGGFLTAAESPMVSEDTAHSFFLTHVEAAYNSSRKAGRGLGAACPVPLHQ